MKRFLILFTIMVFAAGCYYDKSQNLYPSTSNDSCSITNVSYAAVIQPIIQGNCAIPGCHDAYSTNGFLLDNYTHTQVWAANGQLVGAITHAPNYTPMPETGGSLTPCQISQIEAWVNAGSKNN